jgi:hypothetical protein
VAIIEDGRIAQIGTLARSPLIPRDTSPISSASTSRGMVGDGVLTTDAVTVVIADATATRGQRSARTARASPPIAGAPVR